MYNYQGFIAVSYYVNINRWKSLSASVKNCLLTGYFRLTFSSGLKDQRALDITHHSYLQLWFNFCWPWSPIAPWHIYYVHKGETINWQHLWMLIITKLSRLKGISGDQPVWTHSVGGYADLISLCSGRWTDCRKTRIVMCIDSWVSKVRNMNATLREN